MNTHAPLHLCVTHSPLVTRVFQAAMDHAGVPVESVRTLARRATPFQGPGMCMDDVSDEMERCYRKLDRKGYHACRARLDETLLDLTGGAAFTAYVPHANKILYQEIISHPLCAGYCYLEEGFTSMEWSTRRNARSSLSKIIRSRVRSRLIRANYRFTRPMFDHAPPHYRAAYAISACAFRGMPGRIDVSAFIPPPPPGDPPGKTYLILDAAYLHFNVRWEDYEDALLDAVLRHAPPSGELLVKFHFADSLVRERFESLSRRLAESGACEPRLLDRDFPVEENLTRQDLLLFGVTSLGYYTALAGGRVRCFAALIVSINEWIAAGRLPADFREVTGLDGG